LGAASSTAPSAIALEYPAGTSLVKKAISTPVGPSAGRKYACGINISPSEWEAIASTEPPVSQRFVEEAKPHAERTVVEIDGGGDLVYIKNGASELHSHRISI
jgi:hypothetical protein